MTEIPPPSLKETILKKFQSDGYWLIDLPEIPKGLLSGPVENCVDSLIKRV